MNTKRIVSLFASLSLVLSMSLGLTGCGDKAAQDDNQGSTDGESTKYTVGICQLVQHEALDAATQGFIDALNSRPRMLPATAPTAPPSSMALSPTRSTSSWRTPPAR